MWCCCFEHEIIILPTKLVRLSPPLHKDHLNIFNELLPYPCSYSGVVGILTNNTLLIHFTVVFDDLDLQANGIVFCQ